MDRFTTDNTEGYTQGQLDELNDRFAEALKLAGEIREDIRKSHEDHIAEDVLAEFDSDQ